MNNGTLTKDTYKCFCIIYKEYLSRRKNNLSKTEAVHFTKEELNHIFLQYDYNDLGSSLQELKQCEFISKNVLGSIEIQEDGIKFMENKVGNTIEKVIDIISNII